MAILASTPVDACPVMVTAYRPVLQKSSSLLPEGGVLLGASTSFGQRKTGKLALVDDNGLAIDVTEDQLAPGLMRLTPKTHLDRELDVQEDGKTLLHLQDAAGAPVLAAVPRIAKVTSTRAKVTARTMRYLPSETTTITLASAPPAGIVALVLYGKDFTARAWLPTNTGRTYQLSFGGKRCGGIGMSGTEIGEDVMFAFVDDAGRVSTPTKPIRVKRTPPPPPPPKIQPAVAPVAKIN